MPNNSPLFKLHSYSVMRCLKNDPILTLIPYTNYKNYAEKVS